jgi:hypothetical protein
MPKADFFIPRELEELTPAYLTDVLTQRGVLKSSRVTGVRREILGEGEGFVGVLARMFLEFDSPEDGAPATLIAKLPTPIAQNRAMGELLGAYEREILYYEELASEVPLRVPRTYYAALDPDRGSEKQEQIMGTMDKMPLWLIRASMPLARWIAKRKNRRYVLLMEDLGGARVGDQVAGAEIDECRRVLVAMARAHAALWESPLLEGRFWLIRQDLQCRTRHQMYRTSRRVFAERFAGLMGDGLDRLSAFLDTDGEEVTRRLHRDAPETLIHGDFRLDNVFFDGREPDPGVVLIDFQLVGRGCAAYDVAYMLGGALSSEASSSDEEGLLRAYHEELLNGGVKDYEFARFRRDYERGLLTVLQTIATTDMMEMGEDRGAELIRLWVERLVARGRNLDLPALV